MSVMLSLLSWLLLVMAAGGGLHTNLATAEVTIASNSAVVSAYWHTTLPSTPMPLAILELLSPPAGESHIGRVNHKHGAMSNNVFLEEALKPGSTITCYVLPSHTSGAPLLRRDVADSIPMSTRNFTDILTMFAPASNVMAADIWSTLEQCEHPDALKGETKACATSVESMVEFVASVLGVGTHNLRAFSSPDAPAEGIMPGRGYKVAVATRVTEAEDTMTCHGGRFPFAVFMCHTLNPTRVYSVTLEAENAGADGAPRRMEVLAICHLDTSGFDPARMPLHVKPGDAPLCHFLSRDSIIWAPAAAAAT